MKTIILKQNSKEIRDKIEAAGLKVCFCAAYEEQAWLVFYTRFNRWNANYVHGVGYADFKAMKQEQILKLFLDTATNPYVCKDVNEFINKIKDETTDLTRMFGKGNEPKTVKEFEQRAEEIVGPPYYHYSDGK